MFSIDYSWVCLSLWKWTFGFCMVEFLPLILYFDTLS